MNRLKTVPLCSPTLVSSGLSLPNFVFQSKGSCGRSQHVQQLRGDETCVVFSEFCRALSLTPRAKIVAKQIARLFHICVRARARSECQGSGSRLRGFDPYLIRRANGHAFIWRKR